MNVTLLTTGAIVAIGGSLLTGWSRRKHHAFAQAERLRARDVAALPPGSRVGLFGTVTCDEPIDDPVTHIPAIYSRIYATESGGGGGDDNGESELYDGIERAARFGLRDETGEVEVQAETFEVQTTPRDASDDVAADRTLNLRGASYSVSHSCIPVGRQIFAEGHVAEQDGRRFLTGPGLTLDGRSAAALRSTVAAWLGASIFLVVLGLAVAVAGAAIPDPSDPDPVPAVQTPASRTGPR
ncbi:MAG TPA: hypothetical protein VGK67_01415 [Myxococcales bacterium]